MLNELKSLILDYQEQPFEPTVERALEVSVVPGKATICIGVRRCGKSTYMSQLMQKILMQGVQRTNILHLNFLDDRLYNLQHQSLGVINEAYYSLFPEKKNVEKVYYFFDEIQVLNMWENFVERLLRTEKCEVYITGSSAKMLSKEIATQMRGRSLSWEMFPFSLSEYLKFKSVEYTKNLSTKGRLLVQKAFSEYFETGGFPEVINCNRDVRMKIHQEYFNVILNRDIIERHNVKNPKAVMDLSHWLVNNIACRYTINSLLGYLKSIGHKTSKISISEYLDWFEDSYFLFTVHIFDASIKRQSANDKKIYCIDHSLVTSVASGILVNSGHLLENLVFVTIRRFASEIYYYRTEHNREVDFITILPNRQHLLIQVCESIIEPKTCKREVDALNEAMQELGCKVGVIVTLNQEQRIEIPAGIVIVIPAWKFLLGPVESIIA